MSNYNFIFKSLKWKIQCWHWTDANFVLKMEKYNIVHLTQLLKKTQIRFLWLCSSQWTLNISNPFQKRFQNVASCSLLCLSSKGRVYTTVSRWQLDAQSQLSSTLTNLIILDIFFNHYDENFAAGLFGDRKRKVERGLPDLKRLQRLPPRRLHIQYQAAH